MADIERYITETLSLEDKRPTLPTYIQELLFSARNCRIDDITELYVVVEAESNFYVPARAATFSEHQALWQPLIQQAQEQSQGKDDDKPSGHPCERPQLLCTGSACLPTPDTLEGDTTTLPAASATSTTASDTTSTTSTTSTPAPASLMVLCKRGGVTFADKCIRAVNASASAPGRPRVRALVVGQTSPEWPYVMRDGQGQWAAYRKKHPLPQSSEDEDGNAGPLAVVMVSQSDYPRIRQVCQNGGTLSVISRPMPLTCAICTDDITPDATEAAAAKSPTPTIEVAGYNIPDSSGHIVTLPCGHILHTACCLPWLTKQNTCPICRFHMPCERPDEPKETAAPRDLWT